MLIGLGIHLLGANLIGWHPLLGIACALGTASLVLVHGVLDGGRGRTLMGALAVVGVLWVEGGDVVATIVSGGLGGAVRRRRGRDRRRLARRAIRSGAAAALRARSRRGRRGSRRGGGGRGRDGRAIRALRHRRLSERASSMRARSSPVRGTTGDEASGDGRNRSLAAPERTFPTSGEKDREASRYTARLIVFTGPPPLLSDIDRVLAHVDEHLDDALERLFALLSIDSVSTDPAHADACRRAADHLVEDLATIGFAAARHDTPGHPMVLARHDGPNSVGTADSGNPDSNAGSSLGAGAAPHLLFYGHYDVQPADPIEEWRNPPFEPDPGGGRRARRPVIRGARRDRRQGAVLTTHRQGRRRDLGRRRPARCRVNVKISWSRARRRVRFGEAIEKYVRDARRRQASPADLALVVCRHRRCGTRTRPDRR